MRYFVRLAGRDHCIEVTRSASGLVVACDHEQRSAVVHGTAGSYHVLLGERVVELSLGVASAQRSGPAPLQVHAMGKVHAVELSTEREAQAVAERTNEKARVHTLVAQMPGKVLHVRVQPGTRVSKGQPLLVIEAMKMENELHAEKDLHIIDVLVRPGDAVEAGAALLRVE